MQTSSFRSFSLLLSLVGENSMISICTTHMFSTLTFTPHGRLIHRLDIRRSLPFHAPLPFSDRRDCIVDLQDRLLQTHPPNHVESDVYRRRNGEIVSSAKSTRQRIGHLPHRSTCHCHHHPNGHYQQSFENHDVVAAEEQLLALYMTAIDVDEGRNEQSRANVSSQLSRHQGTRGNVQ